MKQLLTFASIVLALILVSCSSVSVNYDFDPEYDFATFKAYRWANAKEVNPNDELLKYPIIQKRVVAAVDAAMKEKGYELVDGDDFDFVIMAHAGSKERMQVYNTGYSAAYGGYGGWYDPWWGPYGGSTHVSYYEESTLVLDIVHWEKKELAWRGLATGTVREENRGGKQEAQINDIVSRVLANFPPESAAK